MDYRALFDRVQEGHEDALAAYIDLKRYAEDLGKYLEALKDQAVDEFNDKYGGKEQQVHGARVRRHSSGR